MMSKLDELIAEYCPDGVEYVKLNNICISKKGNSITKKEIVEGDIPVIAGGQKPAYYCNISNRTGETIAISSSGAAGYVSYWNIPIFVSDAFSVDIKNLHEVSVRYVFHFLLNIQQKIYATTIIGLGVKRLFVKTINSYCL